MSFDGLTGWLKHLVGRQPFFPHQKCLRALHRVIRPGGLLSITEHLPDPDFSRFSRLRELVEREGFEFSERFGPPWSYTANFRRPPTDGKNPA